MLTMHSQRRSQSGSVLLESLISVLIFLIGIIVLVTLSSKALTLTGQSKARNDASNLAGELLAEMWVSSNTPETYDTSVWLARVQSILPDGDAAITFPATNQVKVVITWADKRDVSTPGAPVDVSHSYETTGEIVKN